MKILEHGAWNEADIVFDADPKVCAHQLRTLADAVKLGTVHAIALVAHFVKDGPAGPNTIITRWRSVYSGDPTILGGAGYREMLDWAVAHMLAQDLTVMAGNLTEAAMYGADHPLPERAGDEEDVH